MSCATAIISRLTRRQTPTLPLASHVSHIILPPHFQQKITTAAPEFSFLMKDYVFGFITKFNCAEEWKGMK